MRDKAAAALPKEGRGGVAVSGGADSVALLYYLAELKLALTVLHVNYRLRGAESDADEQFVRELAANLGFPVLVHRPDLPQGNLEAEARKARYRWFEELIARREVDWVALGHTQSDQAETVLFRFLRGSGTAGLAGIWPTTRTGMVRPLLDVTREEVREFLRERQAAWREDSSNGDLRFARNRIRGELLPAIERDWNPALTATLAQTAAWAQAEEEYWQVETPRAAATCVDIQADCATLYIPGFQLLPVAVARRVLRWTVARLKFSGREVEFDHIERVRFLAASPAGAGWVCFAGLAFHRSFEWIRISRASPSAEPFRFPVEIPGRVRLPGSPVRLDFELKHADSVYNECGHQLDWDVASGSLELRNWRPGDTYRRAGQATPRKLKSLLHKARIPSWERSQWPVITRDNSIIWSRLFGPSAEVARSPQTRTVLLVREVGECSNQKA